MENDNAVALVNLALLAMSAGHNDAAVRSFGSALELRPNMVEACVGLGLAYSRMGEYLKMVDGLRQAIQINPATVRGWAKCSVPGKPKWFSFSPEYAHITGQKIEYLRRLDEADATVRLAAAHISVGHDVAAIKALEYCLGSLAPNYEAAIVLVTLGYLLLKKSDKKAVQELGGNSVLRKMLPKLAKNLFEK